MNLLSLVTKPLKKVYGAEIKDKTAPRPWGMRTKRNSAAYKSMVYTFGGIDNVPAFVRNNGCPWAMVSTASILLLPLTFTIKNVIKPIKYLGEKIKVSDLASKKRVKGMTQLEAIDAIEKFFNETDITTYDLKKYWWNDCGDFNESFDRWKDFDSDTIGIGIYGRCLKHTLPFEDGEFKFPNAIRENAKNGSIRAYSYELEHIKRMFSMIQSDPLTSSTIMHLYMRIFICKNADTWKETFKNIEVPNKEDNPIIKQVMLDLVKDDARRKRIEKICMITTKVGQTISKVILNVGVVTVLLGIIIGLIQFFTNVGAVGTWFGSWIFSFLDFTWKLILGCIGVVLAGGLVAFVWCNFIDPDDKVGPKLNKVGTKIFTPFEFIFSAIGSVVKTLFMVFKSECPINEFED